MNLENGAVINQYKILSPIGKGGMGEVYLAEDTKLNRRVALKFLSVSVSNDKNRLRRFEQEAFAASALNHPNILTIYEFGAEAETYFGSGSHQGEMLKFNNGHYYSAMSTLPKRTASA